MSTICVLFEVGLLNKVSAHIYGVNGSSFAKSSRWLLNRVTVAVCVTPWSSCFMEVRNVMDPKRHYKKSNTKLETLPKYFQMGTVVEPASEYFSGRLTKKERKGSLADELLNDRFLSLYRSEFPTEKAFLRMMLRDIEGHYQISRSSSYCQ
ncbi:hypothetical protein RND81_13G166300 [Saponaria officinalis]